MRLENERLAPTEAGIKLTDFLAQRFPAVFDYEYTALLESALDQIAAGQTPSGAVLQTFWDSKLAPPLKALAGEVAQQSYTPKVLGVCPQCGGKLVERRSAKGTFAGCENFPTCTGKIVRFTKVRKASKA